jgi:hypothetical protein
MHGWVRESKMVQEIERATSAHTTHHRVPAPGVGIGQKLHKELVPELCECLLRRYFDVSRPPHVEGVARRPHVLRKRP